MKYKLLTHLKDSRTTIVVRDQWQIRDMYGWISGEGNFCRKLGRLNELFGGRGEGMLQMFTVFACLSSLFFACGFCRTQLVRTKAVSENRALGTVSEKSGLTVGPLGCWQRVCCCLFFPRRRIRTQKTVLTCLVQLLRENNTIRTGHSFTCVATCAQARKFWTQ